MTKKNEIYFCYVELCKDGWIVPIANTPAPMRISEDTHGLQIRWVKQRRAWKCDRAFWLNKSYLKQVAVMLLPPNSKLFSIIDPTDHATALIDGRYNIVYLVSKIMKI